MKKKINKIKRYMHRFNSGFEIREVSALINGIMHTFTGNLINIGEGTYILK